MRLPSLFPHTSPSQWTEDQPLDQLLELAESVLTWSSSLWSGWARWGQVLWETEIQNVDMKITVIKQFREMIRWIEKCISDFSLLCSGMKVMENNWHNDKKIMISNQWSSSVWFYCSAVQQYEHLYNEYQFILIINVPSNLYISKNLILWNNTLVFMTAEFLIN